MDRDYPDIVAFEPRYPVARKAHVCEMCGDPIAVGEKYQRLACVEDGVFRSTVEHFRADAYPSGCPKFARRHDAELAAQFEKDRALFGDR